MLNVNISTDVLKTTNVKIIIDCDDFKCGNRLRGEGIRLRKSN